MNLVLIFNMHSTYKLSLKIIFKNHVDRCTLKTKFQGRIVR